ncbi:MAG: hypothetical protein KatS3mg116_2050 [Elioraea sp.]|nr:MAG: hypothetical protein KatS3mg116_2050 [Elioraea sp.]
MARSRAATVMAPSTAAARHPAAEKRAATSRAWRTETQKAIAGRPGQKRA